MPRLPHIPSREAIKVMEQLGFVQVRQTGSHRPIYVRTTTIVKSLSHRKCSSH